MSELKHIYRNAANIIRAKFSSLKGVNIVLSDLERKIGNGEVDPRINRDLFFEPRIDSQRLSVPLDTAESVAQQLLTFGILRLWVRVQCSNHKPGEAATILETDESSDFTELIEQSCEHCGGFHEFSPDDFETVYAINTMQDYSQQAFDYSALQVKPFVHSESEGTNSDLIRCETAAYRVGGPRNPPPHDIQLIAVALGGNRNLQTVPSPSKIWMTAWLGPLILIVAYLILIIPVVRLCGQIVAIVVSVVVLIALFLVIRGQVNAKLAPTIVQRLALWGGLSLSTGCVTAGATGLHFKGEAGKGEPWWSQVDFGEVSEPLIRYGFFFFALTLLFVFAFDLQRGWLKGKSDQEA